MTFLSLSPSLSYTEGRVDDSPFGVYVARSAGTYILDSGPTETSPNTPVLVLR